MTKKSFSHFWMAMGSDEGSAERAKSILNPAKKYFPSAKNVLELGVGVGHVIKFFPKQFSIYGLDITKKNIALCKKIVPNGKYIVSSMHNFKMKERFDLIFSVYDSINFLENFQKWKQTFKRVHKHLNDKGLFIFDAYTPKALTYLKNLPLTISKFPLGYDGGQAIIKGNSLIWDYKVFEKKKKKMYELHQYVFKENIYPLSKIKQALKEKFIILEENYFEDKKKILFVCRKKP